MGFESLVSSDREKGSEFLVNSGRFPHAAILEDEDSERLMDTGEDPRRRAGVLGTISPCGRCNCLKALRILIPI